MQHGDQGIGEGEQFLELFGLLLEGQTGFAPEGQQVLFKSGNLAARELARRINLPIGHEVEIWLYGGVRLRGKLRLKEEKLFIEEERVRHLELLVDHVVFTYREMESCVRLD